MNGHFCDNCECHLNESDYTSNGSWSYTCHTCGFTYVHGAATAQEQVEKFNNVIGEKSMELTTKDGVKELMQSSKSEKEWNANCDKVKAANNGYPSFWFAEVVMSGLMDKTAKTWGGNADITVTTL